MNKKNIFLIMTDQHRLDTMKYANGNTVVCTAYLDELAEQSVCFDQAYTTCPVCTPARASIHTGHFPSLTGMCTNIYNVGCSAHELMDSPNLLSRRLEKQGYASGFTGKWHLGVGKDKTASTEGREILERMEIGDMSGAAYLDYGTLPTDIGFIGDDFPGHGNGGWKAPQFLDYLKENGLELEMEGKYGGKFPGQHSHGGVITSGIETTVEYYLTNRAIDITTELQKSGSPFFFTMNIWGPHEPYFVPKEYYDKFRDMSITPWESFEGDRVETNIHKMVRRSQKSWAFFENNLRHYYAYIEHIDAQIGRFLTFLKDNGLYDDSYIIFSADHGDSQGCHHGLENKSCHMYDEIMKIPLMIKPAGGTEHRVEHGFASTVDIYSTIVSLAGEKENLNHGVSLEPYWNNDLPLNPRKDVMAEGISAFPLVTSQRMYRTGDWKYVFNYGGNDELYNLSHDPHELTNLESLKEHGEMLRTFRENLANIMKETNDPAAQFFCKYFNLLDYSCDGDF